MASRDEIKPSALLKTEVDGKAIPLLGEEQLVQDEIRAELNGLLKRRSFRISDSGGDFRVRLTYSTVRNDKFRSSSYFSSASSSSLASGSEARAGSTTGLGIAIARALSWMSTTSIASSENTVENVTSYTHTIAVEFINKDDSLVWKGEATWESDELNILVRLLPSLQVLLSDLPGGAATLPEVPKVKPSHSLNYFRLTCVERWFSCPALPYRISVESKNDLHHDEVPDCITDPMAFAAYTDLIQTAEFALPEGDDNWKDPLRPELWRKVLLGGQYILTPGNEKANVLISLEGNNSGYFASKCWIAKDAEYANFENRLNLWKTTLQAYYSVFEK